MNGKTWDIAMFLARWTVGTALLYAAAAKLFSSTGGVWGVDLLQQLLGAQGVVPAAWAGWIARTVVLVELVLGAAMVLPYAPKWAGWMSVGLLMVLTLYTLVVYIHQGRVICACFGRIQPAELPWVLTRNILLMVASGVWLLRPAGPGPVGASSLAGKRGSPIVGG